MTSNLSSNRAFGILSTIICLFTSIIIYGFVLSILIWISLLLLTFAILFPNIFKYPNIAWIKFGILIGKIINPIVCTLLYIIVIGGTKIFLDLFKKKLIYKEKYNTKSYWKIRNDKLYENFNNQF